MKHVHCDLIKAWADGAQVQYLAGLTTWRDVIGTPCWSDDTQYRIKPKIITFRNALMGGNAMSNYVIACNQYPQAVEKDPWFIKWLGDWQEVETS
jgi:hypothetical protein